MHFGEANCRLTTVHSIFQSSQISPPPTTEAYAIAFATARACTSPPSSEERELLLAISTAAVAGEGENGGGAGRVPRGWSRRGTTRTEKGGGAGGALQLARCSVLAPAGHGHGGCAGRGDGEAVPPVAPSCIPPDEAASPSPFSRGRAGPY
jgi:hypothetical protein